MSFIFYLKHILLWQKRKLRQKCISREFQVFYFDFFHLVRNFIFIDWTFDYSKIIGNFCHYISFFWWLNNTSNKNVSSQSNLVDKLGNKKLALWSLVLIKAHIQNKERKELHKYNYCINANAKKYNNKKNNWLTWDVYNLAKVL